MHEFMRAYEALTLCLILSSLSDSSLVGSSIGSAAGVDAVASAVAAALSWKMFLPDRMWLALNRREVTSDAADDIALEDAMGSNRAIVVALIACNIAAITRRLPIFGEATGCAKRLCILSLLCLSDAGSHGRRHTFFRFGFGEGH